MLKILAKILIGSSVLMVILIAYVVLRHVVHWTPVEDVSFDNDEITLSGSLIKPADDGPFPAVVLLHGSGPEPRSDPQTRVIINLLVNNGFAVLAYDKRGVGESGGDFEEALYPHFVSDGVAAVRYLLSRGDIDVRLIGLYAVSEGNWLAPEIAVRTGAVSFIFNKVGCPLPVEESWLHETYVDYLNAGFSEVDAGRIVALQRLRWDYYQDAAADSSLADGPRRDAINAQSARLREEIPGAQEWIPPQLVPYDQEDHARFAANSGYDPGPFIDELEIPMYFTLAENDVNNPVERCVAALDLLIDEGKMIEYHVFAGAGHSLASWKGMLQMGYVPGYLRILDDWTAAQLDSPELE